MKIIQKGKNFFWNMPILSGKKKEQIFYSLRAIIKKERGNTVTDESYLDLYKKQILAIPTYQDPSYSKIVDVPFQRQNGDPKILAYYLTQFHPTSENDAWWGKGITEWNNVSRAVPQFIGHYQPRLPGELGFYDLRIEEVLERQTELAKLYGIYGFCFYYYWFSGKRLLEKPLNMYCQSKKIDFPFCLCWANESWTKGFFGSSREIIMKQEQTVGSYKSFIHDIVPYLSHPNYMTIQGKKVLQIYRPQDIPNPKEVIQYWRDYCKQMGVGEIYLIACWTLGMEEHYIEDGFDAMSEFHPGSVLPYCTKINSRIPFVNKSFIGEVYSYKEIVEQKAYSANFDKRKLYNAVMPMWDNTPRRNNRGNVIFHGSTPDLYKTWLKDIINNNKKRNDLDENMIFMNAWNEWGEGAYLEPDKRFGYAYLQATKEAIEETRKGE